MYEELIERLREYPDREETTGGYVEVDWQDLLDAADAIKALTAQLSALQTKNGELRSALSRVEAERDAAVTDLHSMHTLCMEIGGCCPECGGQIDELLDAACTFCKGPGVSCWKNDLDNESECAAFEWRGAQGEG